MSPHPRSRQLRRGQRRSSDLVAHIADVAASPASLLSCRGSSILEKSCGIGDLMDRGRGVMKGGSSRFALVIGNGAYLEDLELDSPPLDAKEMGAALAELGFDVIMSTNASFQIMEKVLNEFIERVESATRVETVLFYFSGHGICHERQNYMVPIDFDETASSFTKLVDVQYVIDRLLFERHGNLVKIILFDACRSGDTEEENVTYERRIGRAFKGKGILTPKGAEDVFVDGGVAPKFTTMSGGQNTFIAFATAEGRAAYGETGVSLSLFTAALLRNINSVDLPLTNLMSRVRIEVLKLTDQEQNTWDQSSLNQPFFFNPGSLLMFNGSAMALVGLFLSVISYSFLLAAGKPWVWVAVAALLPVISLSIMLVGMQSAYSRLKGNFDATSEDVEGPRDHVVASLLKGIVGGYLGSLVAGLGIGVPYYIAWADFEEKSPGLHDPLEPLGVVLIESTVATALTACVLGFLCLLWARLDWKLSGPAIAKNPSVFRIVGGSIAGGMLAGLVAAPILTMYFGLKSRPELSPDLLIPGAILGTIFVIFSIVNFDFERLTLRRIRASASAAGSALLVGLFTAVVLMGALYLAGAVDWVANFLRSHADDLWALALGGAMYGIPVGAILGSVIGSALVLTAKFSGAPVLGR